MPDTPDMPNPLTPLQKEAFLRSINKVPVQAIYNRINSKELTLEECVENGMDESKVDEINLLQLESEAALQVQIEEQTKLEEDQAFYDKINNDDIIIQEIQNALFDGRVTEEGLLNNIPIIDDSLLSRIKSYTKQFHPSENNDVPLIAGTDIFFFGKSGSGKSCVLASIFNYAEDEGLFIDNTVSIKGINYKDLLVRELKNGILPDATSATKEAVTYITTELHKDGEVNPLNFVEMSGEFFSEAAQDPEAISNTIDAHGYWFNGWFYVWYCRNFWTTSHFNLHVRFKASINNQRKYNAVFIFC